MYKHGPVALLGFAESFSSPEVVWSLDSAGFTVWAFARRGSRTPLRVSKYVKIIDITPPEVDAVAASNELSDHLAEISERSCRRVALLPLDDAALWIFQQLSPIKSVTIAGPAGLQADLALNKDHQIELARKAGFNVPATVVLSKGMAAPRGLEFPVVLKPAHAVCLRNGKLVKDKFYVCWNADELESHWEKVDGSGRWLVQQHVHGVGEGLFGLGTAEGVLAWSAHRRVRMMNPIGSGSSACVSIEADPHDVEMAARLMKEVSWQGLFMIELLRERGGRAWFVELNGRVWGSTALARRCGLEYPLWAVSCALNKDVDLPTKELPKLGVVCRHAGREALHALFVLRGSGTNRSLQWPAKWKTFRDLLTFGKDQYWYNWRRDDWRVFVRDFVSTIADAVLKN